MIHIKYIYTVISWAPDQAACLPEAHTFVVPLPPQIGLDLGTHSPTNSPAVPRGRRYSARFLQTQLDSQIDP